jgi:hypothetical protein
MSARRIHKNSVLPERRSIFSAGRPSPEVSHPENKGKQRAKSIENISLVDDIDNLGRTKAVFQLKFIFQRLLNVIFQRFTNV